MSDNDIIAVVQENGMDPCTFQYYNQLKNRTILLNGYVDESFVEMVILPLKEFENDDSCTPVNLILNTGGGSVMDGLILVNIIDNYKKPLNIYVYGYACSMGTIILCAGNKNPNVKKFCYPFSFGLLHCGNVAVQGEASSVEDTMVFNKKIDKLIKEYVIANTNITEEEYTYYERHQGYMLAPEMKEKGLINEIIGE